MPLLTLLRLSVKCRSIKCPQSVSIFPLTTYNTDNDLKLCHKGMIFIYTINPLSSISKTEYVIITMSLDFQVMSFILSFVFLLGLSDDHC